MTQWFTKKVIQVFDQNSPQMEMKHQHFILPQGPRRAHAPFSDYNCFFLEGPSPSSGRNLGVSEELSHVLLSSSLTVKSISHCQ